MRKILALVMFAFMAAEGVALAALLLPAHQSRQAMLDRCAALKSELDERIKKRMELEKRFFDLQNSPDAIEKVAREKFNYSKPGETVLKRKNSMRTPNSSASSQMRGR